MEDRGSESDSTSDVVSSLRDDPVTVTSLIGHFYRGELDRTTSWRTRLDQTSNWAVVVVAAILTWVFSSPDNPHYVLLIGMLAVVAFLLTEAHRYREYDIWRSRVRTLQRNVFAGVFASDAVADVGSGTDSDASSDATSTASPDENWQSELSRNLRTPTFSMPYWMAVGHRLRRVYLGLLSLLLVAWTVRVTLFEPGKSWRETAALPGVDASVLVAVLVVGYAGFVSLAVASVRGSEIEEVDSTADTRDR